MSYLQQADLALQSGKYQAAMDLVHAEIKQHGESSRALTILALATYHGQNNVREALGLLDKAYGLDPNNLLPLFNCGIISLQAGLLDQAIDALQRFIKRKADTPEAYFNLGNAQFQKELYTAAHHSFTEATRLNGSYIDAHNNLGLTCKQLKRYPEAIEAFNHALRLGAGGDTLFNLGLVYQLSGEIQQAIGVYQQALKLSPSLENCWYNLGICYTDKNHTDQAITCFQKAHECNPTDPRYLNNLGLALLESKRPEDAVQVFREVLKRNGVFAEAHTNLGLCLEKLGQTTQAGEAYAKAVLLDPKLSKAQYNQANFLKRSNMLQEAITGYQKAIALEPHFVDAHVNQSHCLLMQGRYQEGFREYLWRWQESEAQKKKRTDLSEWQGEDIGTTPLLVYSEQGFGDTIQFSRYIPFFKDLVGEIYVACEPCLVDLLQGMETVTQVVAKEEALPARARGARGVPLINLPFYYHQQIAQVPPPLTLRNYQQQAARFRELFSADDRLRVGLAWQGNPANVNDHNRSCSLDYMEELSRLRGECHFFSLQKDSPAGTRLPTTITDLATLFSSFNETAALLTHLDLVITIDSAVAHLAGTLGIETWLLVPVVPDWRWMLDRSDSVWYPKVKIFRQQEPQQWQPVFDAVARALGAFSRPLP